MSDEIEARHKKELKALETEKRAAIKKVKGTAGKGKKAKELLADTEVEFDAKLKALEEMHAAERSAVCQDDKEETPAVELPTQPDLSEDEKFKLEKQEKARKKRDKLKEKQLERQRQIEEENANAGPSPRDVENEMIQQYLDPLGLEIKEVAADGHCLYRAVGACCHMEYPAIREICADSLTQNEDDLSPFCEFSDSIPDFISYVNSVRSSADWGGHIELRALSIALKRPIWVYSATNSQNPLIVHADGVNEDENPIRVSYHQHYYALGEHYNLVVPKAP